MSLTTNIDNIYKRGEIGNVRKAQEDSHDIFLKTPNGDAFVVCDGMGGHVGGAVASSTAVRSIKEYLEKEKYPNPIQALDGALQFANQQILGYANEHPELKGMGTTACILLFQGDEAWIAHVGDSRIYLYLGKEKQLHRITKDHSYVQTLVDSGQIKDEEAEHHPNKNRILKALGVSLKLEPTFNYGNKPILPKNDDIFLICSDGLSGMIPDKTIERVLSQKDSTLEQKGDLLIDLAMQGETVQPGGQDNCTVELIKVDNSPWKTSEFKSYNPIKAKGGVKLPGGKTLSPKLIAAVVVLLLVLGVIGWFAHCRNVEKEHQKEIENIEKEIEETTKKLTSNNVLISRVNNDIKEVDNNDKDNYTEINKERLRGLNDELANYRRVEDSLNSRLEVLKNELLIKNKNSNESNNHRQKH